LLERLRAIARGHNFIHVEDDVQTNAAFTNALLSNNTQVVYFQGRNILVKVDGTDDETKSKHFPKKKPVFRAESSPMNTIDDAVLFSAHFDSVSTAPGATDDGMSVVALVQMVDFLSKNRPRRTAVFNFNNGEEDGLHGAQAWATFMYRLSLRFNLLFYRFLRHPWSNLTSTFLNFEGAGSGGCVSSTLPMSSVQISRIRPFFSVAPSSSDRLHMTSSKSFAPHHISMPTSFLRTLGIEVSSARTPITPSTLPLGPGTFPTSQGIMRLQVPLLTDMKALGVVCKGRTSPSIAHGHVIIPWTTRSEEWAMMVLKGPSGCCWSYCVLWAIPSSM